MRFRRIRHTFDARQFEYISNPTISKCESGFSFLRGQCRVNPEFVEDISFWVHEFSELSIIRILNGWKKPVRRLVIFDGFKSTRVPHFITPYGVKNGRNLETSTRGLRW